MPRLGFCRFLASSTLVLSVVTSFFAPTVAQAAVIGFTGPYEVSNWTLLSDPAGGDGSVDTSLAPASVTITGSDNGRFINAMSVNTDYTVVAAGTGLVSFNWTYFSVDVGNTDRFGYLHNGIFTQLANNDSQGSGLIQFGVVQGETFGFRVFSEDNGYGPGVATISSFDAPVPELPEPTSMAIFGFGALGMAFRAHRRIRS